MPENSGGTGNEDGDEDLSDIVGAGTEDAQKPECLQCQSTIEEYRKGKAKESASQTEKERHKLGAEKTP